MKVHFRNFRCYENQTFDFGSQGGLALISGPSGRGKSTILMGIHFALYGVGTKVVAHGKTSCSVRLEIDDWVITRTKRPNRLTIEEQGCGNATAGFYEDDAAQSMIDKVYGQMFDVTGYIAQNALRSFVMLSPTEKLSFLEKFAFRDVDLPALKQKCKAHIQRLDADLVYVSGELAMAENLIQQAAQQPIKPVRTPFPIPVKNPKIARNIEIATKNEHTRLKNSTVRLRNEEKRLMRLCVVQESVETKADMIANLERNSDLYRDDASLPSCWTDAQLAAYEKRLVWLRTTQKLVQQRAQLAADRETLTAMRQTEEEAITQTIAAIEANLWTDETHDQAREELRDLQETKVALDTIMRLQKELDVLNHKATTRTAAGELSLENLHALIESRETDMLDLTRTYENTKIYQEIYACPHCQKKLRLRGSSSCSRAQLEMVPDDLPEGGVAIVDELPVLAKKIAALRQEIAMLRKTLVERQKECDRVRAIEAELAPYLATYADIALDDVIANIEYFQTYIRSNLQQEKSLQSAKERQHKQTFSSSYISFAQAVERAARTLADLEKQSEENGMVGDEDDDATSVDYTEQELYEQKARRTKRDRAQTELQRVEDTIHRLMHEVLVDLKNSDITIADNPSDNARDGLGDGLSAHMRAELLNHAISTVKQRRVQCEKDVASLQAALEGHRSNLEAIEAWHRQESAIAAYEALENKVRELSDKERDLRHRYTAATTLREKIIESESVAMVQIIDSINAHAQIYLETFFPDDPIAVRVVSFKEVHKGTGKAAVKPQINLEIDYKGMECDLTCLSGGELSRVLLAFTLALAEIFHTPLLLLDECTSSLDQELSSVVFDGIRAHYTGKMTIIIAHQVVSGTFDHILDLSGD